MPALAGAGLMIAKAMAENQALTIMQMEAEVHKKGNEAAANAI